MRQQLGNEAEQLLRALETEPVCSIRLNSKLDVLTFDCDTDEVPWHVDGYYLREAIYPIIERCMARAYESNVFAMDEGNRVDEEFIQKFMTLGITQYTLEWIENNYKETEADIVDHIFLILRRMYG